MSTIIDGLEKTTKTEIAELLACIESYTPANWVGQTVKSLANIFRKIAKKTVIPAGLNVLYEAKVDELVRTPHDILMSRARNDIVKYGKRVGVRGGSDDMLSVSMMRAVSALYGKQHYSVMSPAEMADDLTVKCKNRDVNKIKRLPAIWGIVAIVIIIITLFLLIYISHKLSGYGIPQSQINKIKLFVIAIGLISEVIWFLSTKKKLSLEKLAYVIAVGGTGYGKTFSVSIDETTISKMDQDLSTRYEAGLRALHTIAGQIDLIRSQIKSLSENNDRLSAEIKKDDEYLRTLNISLSESNADVSFINNQIKEKESEKIRKKESILQGENTISQAKDAIKHFDEQKIALRKILVGQISKLWISSYSELNLLNGFFESMVDSCEWNAFEKIERRLIELLRAQDPQALGEPSTNDQLFIKFSTKQECGQIFYKVDKKINLTGVLRGLPKPDDIALGEDDLRRVLIEYGIIKDAQEPVSTGGISAKKIINSLAVKLKESQVKLNDLSHQNAQLVVEKETLNLEIASKEAEKERLEEERDELKSQLEKSIVDEAERLELQAKLNELNKKISELENDLKDKKIEIDNLNKTYEEKYQKLLTDIKQGHAEIKNLEAAISEKVSVIGALNQENEKLKNNNDKLESDIYLKQKLLDERRKKLDSQGAKATELNNIIEKLESEKKYDEGVIQAQATQITQNEEKQKQLKKEISVLEEAKNKVQEIITLQDNKISQLQRDKEKLENELKSSTILKENKILNEFKNAFKTASSEIDIAVPWLGKYASDEFPDLMESCLKRNVKIKIRYGLKDDNKDKDYSDSRLREKIAKKEMPGTRFEWSVKNIMDLHKRFDKEYPGMFISYRHRSHSKLMMVDNKYYIIGSLNFLSYQRDGSGWGELAEKSENSTVIKTLYDMYFSFEKTKPENDLGI
ncbi:phospholipase D-like domain-containing protein [Butyrivibrio sp. NC2007]|uniref:phospholipase D-like domain-containing protein n=1 Tax=Butyrivibrio sp. NC2007 TaxID=1280683 RepID=UPI0003B6626E|nr:phospholipase D-like domain-containing protein [Butyrivibrio sp. NC2007]